ncbi:lantibiotic biosynthesis protein [Desmospora sp. 8437]|nr:lantibiotic biosynthesis protein [Desmospora sp. 8437]
MILFLIGGMELIQTKIRRSVTGKKGVFEACPFFMLRTPIRPINDFLNLNTGQLFKSHLSSWLDSDVVKEAILVASPRLFEALPRLGDQKNKRKSDQVASSLLRYYSRMSTRPTPFGLFAGITAGRLSDQSVVSVEKESKHKKRTRPDMEWLLRVVHGLEERMEVVRQLRVKKNPGIQSAGGRLVLPYISHCGQAPKNTSTQSDAVTIRATPPVLITMENAQHPIKFGELIQLVHKHFKDQTSIEKVENFLWMLFSQEFLISELRPPLTVDSPLEYVRTRLDSVIGVEGEKETLDQVSAWIQEYDSLPLGKGISTYMKISEKMKQLVDTDSVLQVDLSVRSDRITLHQCVADEVERVGDLLWRLSSSGEGLHTLSQYRNDFLERYGLAGEVPILELFNEETGLGPPTSYRRNRKDEPDPGQPRITPQRERLLMEMVQKSMLDGCREVVLTDEIIEALTDEKDEPQKAPDSLEIYGELLALSPEEVDQGNFRLVLSPNPGSYMAGQTFGRFLDMMDDNTREMVREAQDWGNKPNSIPVEGVFLPKFGRNANVALVSGLRDHELVIGTNTGEGKIPVNLSDIVVGATPDRFYLKSRSLGKEVIILSGNLLNYHQSPVLYRFMREVAFEGKKTWQPFEWGAMERAPFLPRIRYGKTILHPARWNVDRLTLSENDPINWEKQWMDFKCRWRVPRYVFMVYTDHRILLDLEKEEFVDEIRKEMMTKGNVILHEMVGSFDERWVTGPNGNHCNEFIFSLKKKKEYQTHWEIPRKVTVSKPKEKFKLPGNDWIFVKLYGGKSRQDEFICTEIREFTSSLLDSNHIDTWFFMRYQDPDPHLRLRLHGEPEKLTKEVLPLLFKWGGRCRKAGFIRKFVIDTYDREVERYGGPELIADAEQFFFADSETTVSLVELLRYRQVDLPPHVLAAISCIHLLDGLGISRTDQLSLLDGMVKKDQYRKEFRVWRRRMMETVDTLKEHARLEREDWGEKVTLALDKRSSTLFKFREKLVIAERNGGLWNPVMNIAASLIHMHCNRLMGIDSEAEKKAMAFMRHTLESLHHYHRKATLKR